MALALLTNLDESQLKDLENPGKLCSGCDPDVPGHAEKSKCPVCKGKGFEPFSFSGAAAETAASKVPETPNAWGKGASKARGEAELGERGRGRAGRSRGSARPGPGGEGVSPAVPRGDQDQAIRKHAPTKATRPTAKTAPRPTAKAAKPAAKSDKSKVPAHIRQLRDIAARYR